MALILCVDHLNIHVNLGWMYLSLFFCFKYATAQNGSLSKDFFSPKMDTMQIGCQTYEQLWINILCDTIYHTSHNISGQSIHHWFKCTPLVHLVFYDHGKNGNLNSYLHVKGLAWYKYRLSTKL